MPQRNRQIEPDAGFDAVAESRRWKEAVAAEVAGMSVKQRVAWFRRQSSVAAVRDLTVSATKNLILREEPPGDGGEKA